MVSRLAYLGFYSKTILDVNTLNFSFVDIENYLPTFFRIQELHQFDSDDIWDLMPNVSDGQNFTLG